MDTPEFLDNLELMSKDISIGQPLHESTPKRNPEKHKHKGLDSIKILNINCQSVVNKKDQLHSVIDIENPDIVIGTESWLSPSIYDGEIFPPNLNYTVYRRDRQTKTTGGGIFILVRNTLISDLKPQYNTNCENLWVEVKVRGTKPLLIGAYYKPKELDHESMYELKSSLDCILQSDKYSNILLSGDFNLPSMNWNDEATTPGCKNQSYYEQFLTIMKDCNLTQVIDRPTRGENILDLIFTTNTTLVQNSDVIPGIGDHDIASLVVSIKPYINRQQPRKILLYKRADWDGFREYMHTYSDEFCSRNHSHSNVDDLWSEFTQSLEKGTSKFIPSKKARTKNGLPWVNRDIKRLIRQRDKLYIKHRKTGNPKYKTSFKELKHKIQQQIRTAYNDYVGDILGISTEPGNTQSKPDTKKLFTLLKHSKKDSQNIPPLQSGGKTFSDTIEKSDILNSQFHSVFSPKNPLSLQQLCQKSIQDHVDSGKLKNSSIPFQTSLYPSMPSFTIGSEGICKLLKSLQPNKAAGPDKISPMILRELRNEICNIIQVIFNKSLDTGKLPSQWLDANISPIYKKGDRSLPSNYRPISLTCVLCKVMEHIVTSQLVKHFNKHNILYELQHGFREKRSCETQLIMLIHELLQNKQKGKQSDLILLDFSKAFDKVSHEKLLFKLHNYGVRGNILSWIKAFLDNRSQTVVIDGEQSCTAPVSSGVPQGSVLGPILFLVYINDLPDNITSQVRLFADDTVVYAAISRMDDSLALQRDLDTLQVWEQKWDMEFNPSKCQVLQITRARKPIPTKYFLHNQELEVTNSARYLGVDISSNLCFNGHIDRICNTANKTLGFLRRNLKIHDQKVKAVAYQATVRPVLEYCSSCWDPYTLRNISKVEMVQRRAARWVMSDWRQTSSVTNMLAQLNWRTLAQRRADARLVMFFKILHGLVAVPAQSYIPQPTRFSQGPRPHALPQIQTSRDYCKYSFFPLTIVQWNALPPTIPANLTLVGFKEAVCSIEHISPRK